MSNLKGYDATQDGVDRLPTDGDWYAGYAAEPGQRFVSYPQIHSRFPNKPVFAYTLGGAIHRMQMPAAFLLALDFEQGNPDPSPFGWVEQQLRLGWQLHELGVYADESHWNAGIHIQDGVKKIQAHYDGIAEVPPGFDCKQYSDKGGGGAYDLNVSLDSFVSTPHHTPHAAGLANFAGGLVLPDGHWHVHGTRGHFQPGLPNAHWCAKIRMYLPTGAWDIHPLPSEK